MGKQRPSILITANTNAVLSIGSLGTNSASGCFDALEPRADRPRPSILGFRGNEKSKSKSSEVSELACNEYSDSDEAKQREQSPSSASVDSDSCSVSAHLAMG